MTEYLSQHSNTSSESFFSQKVSYRGYDLEFFQDPKSHQMYVEFEGDTLYTGLFNINFVEDVKKMIDNRLDTVFRYSGGYFGARICWFSNGNHRDLGLFWGNRLLYVHVMRENAEIAEIDIISLCTKVLDQLRLSELVEFPEFQEFQTKAQNSLQS